METQPNSANTQQAVAKALKHYGHTGESFQNAQKFLSKSHQHHYTRRDMGELHAALENFRNTKGLELLQRGFKKIFLRTEDSPEEQGFQSIDHVKGDRVFLNQLLLRYAKQANETLYKAFVAPQLETPQNRKNPPTAFYIPQEIDPILLIANPLSCFALLKEAKEYQQRIQHPTRWLYVETFINRWFFKFNHFMLFFQKNREAALFRVFFRKSVPVAEIAVLHEFIVQVIADHLGEESLPLFQESRNNLRTHYLLFIHLLFFLVEQKVPLPLEFHKIFSEYDHVHFFSREDYVAGGMRAAYEKLHPLPHLARNTQSQKEQTLLQELKKKYFLNFWKRYSPLTYPAKIDLLSSFTEVDRFFILERFYQHRQILELARLHQHTESLLNAPEGLSPQDRSLVGSQRSKFLRSLWHIVNKHQLLENMNFSTDPKVLEFVRKQFGQRREEGLGSSEFSIDLEERKKRRKNDWRQLSMHDIPPYTKVKKWSQIARLPFDIPNNHEVLFSFMPYVRINEKRLKDRLTIAHCVELARLPFRYLASHIETRLKFHFITIGDLLLMEILGSKSSSSHSLFRFLLESKQLTEPKMVDLLKKVYPVIDHHFGEILRSNIPYVINHRYVYKGGGINGINAGIAIERINAMQDPSAIYLSAGKMFHRCAESIFFHIVRHLEPQFVEENLTVEKKQIQAYLTRYPMETLIPQCLESQNDQNFAPFLQWWQALDESEKTPCSERMTKEILWQQEMFFHDYPNPYILPTH